MGIELVVLFIVVLFFYVSFIFILKFILSSKWFICECSC